MTEIDQHGAGGTSGRHHRHGGAGAIAIGVLVATLLAGLPGVARATPPEPPASQSFTEFCQGVSSTSQFSDVSSSNQHGAAIRCLVAAEITSGKTSTTYDPSGDITRDQMATFLANVVAIANELEISELRALPAYDGTPDFDDVPQSNTHFTNIMRLSQAGITGGTGPRSFSPRRPVTRAQMARFINNTVDFLTGDRYATANDYFTDDDDSFAEDDINGIASRGVAVGDGRDSYAPGATVRRDQMASFLIRGLAVLHADEQIKALNQDREAADGPINGTGANAQGDANKGAEVRSTAKDAASFVACDITALDAHIDAVDESRCFTYRFDAQDTFVVGGDNSGLAGFLAELSPYDDVTGTYSREGKSTFSLRNEAPLPPEAVTTEATANRVTLTIDDSATPSVDSYNVDRAAAHSALGCQEQAVTYKRIGTAKDPSPTEDSGNATYPDTTVEPGTTYCYKVFSVDDGDQSAGSVTTGAVSTPAAVTPAAGAPTSVDVVLLNDARVGNADEIDAGDQIKLVFNETMATPNDGDSVLVQDKDGTLGQITCGPRTRCTINSSTETVGGTSYERGRVITLLLVTDPAVIGDADPGDTSGEGVTNAPATIVSQAGYVDLEGDRWNLAGSADVVVDDEKDANPPISTDVRVDEGVSGLGGFLDAGDTIVLVFNEGMRAPDPTGDSISVTGAGVSDAYTLTCGALGNATCTLNTTDQTVGGTTYSPGRVINVTLNETRATGTGPPRLPAKITGQSDFEDVATNDWSLCKSPDLTVNTAKDSADAGSTCP